MGGVELRGLKVYAVEEVLHVALVVEDRELCGIEKAAGVQEIDGGEVAEAFGAEGKVGRGSGGAEGAIVAEELACGSRGPLAGAGGDACDERGFFAELGGRRAGDDLKRLNGGDGNLVGEDFGLLIGDRLTVDVEGVFGVIAQAMEESVRVCRNAG